MKLNKPLIRKMIKRIETMPETYEQRAIGATKQEKPWLFEGRPAPMCGTVACLASEAVICSERSVAKGLRRLRSVRDPVWLARNLMGVAEADVWIFGVDSIEWPEPYRSQWQAAKTYKGEARAAVNLLKAILRTDGKILEEQ